MHVTQTNSTVLPMSVERVAYCVGYVVSLVRLESLPVLLVYKLTNIQDTFVEKRI